MEAPRPTTPIWRDFTHGPVAYDGSRTREAAYSCHQLRMTTASHSRGGTRVYIPAPMATTPVDTAIRARAQELIRAYDGRAGNLGRLLGRVTAVDQVGVEER